MGTDVDFWNGIAEAYAQKPVERPEAFERKIDVTQRCMAADHTVLDIGCGTGSLALRLAPGAVHVHGVDVSTEMIRIACAKAAEMQIDNVTFHTGAFDAAFVAPVGVEGFDGICAYSFLHLVADRRAALAHIFRLLKPGGFFVSSTVCLGGTWKPYGPLLWVMHRLGRAPKVALFDAETLRSDMRDAGFTDITAPDVGAKATTAFLVAHKPR